MLRMMAEKASEQDRRKTRLARQLRENLKRRKAQARNLAQSRRGSPARSEKAG